MLEHMSWKISTSRTNGRIFIQIWSVLIELKVAANNFPPPAFPSGVIAAATVAKTTRLLLFTLEWQIKTI